MAHQKAELAIFGLFLVKMLFYLFIYYVGFTNVALLVVHCSDNGSRDNNGFSEITTDHDLDAGSSRTELQHIRMNRIKPHRMNRNPTNKQRVLTNTKLFYFLQDPRTLFTSESRPSPDQITAKSDCKVANIDHPITKIS